MYVYMCVLHLFYECEPGPPSRAIIPTTEIPTTLATSHMSLLLVFVTKFQFGDVGYKPFFLTLGITKSNSNRGHKTECDVSRTNGNTIWRPSGPWLS